MIELQASVRQRKLIIPVVDPDASRATVSLRIKCTSNCPRPRPALRSEGLVTTAHPRKSCMHGVV
eukprot:2215231-Prymnesium_polylepis.2